MEHFIHSMDPYGIVMGDLNDDSWAAAPTRPWKEGLDDASLLDPLLATTYHPDVGQYYTRSRATVNYQDWTLYSCARKYQMYHGLTMTLSACPRRTMPSSCVASAGVWEATSTSHHRPCPL